jgi:hypothetical protein
MSPQAYARPHPRNCLPRLPLPTPLDGHTWPTVPSLLAAYLALLRALDREAQQPFCYASKDALPDSYLSHNLIGLMGSDIHLEGGGWLEEFPHSHENSRWAVFIQWG